jgi:hypothetical protein
MMLSMSDSSFLDNFFTAAGKQHDALFISSEWVTLNFLTISLVLEALYRSHGLALSRYNQISDAGAESLAGVLAQCAALAQSTLRYVTLCSLSRSLARLLALSLPQSGLIYAVQHLALSLFRSLALSL